MIPKNIATSAGLLDGHILMLNFLKQVNSRVDDNFYEQDIAWTTNCNWLRRRFFTFDFYLSYSKYSSHWLGRCLLICFSIIAQVIIGMRALWLVEDYVISRYNHPARDDYNTEALIFKMAAARFLHVFEEETNKMKENSIALIITE